MRRILFLLLPLVILCGCTPKTPMPSYLATPTSSPLSPSGAFRLTVKEGRDDASFWTFEIRRVATSDLEFASNDRFYTRHTTHILWGKSDEVWVYSGDVGTFVWRKQADGHWEKNPYVYGTAAESVPDGLKILKPKLFNPSPETPPLRQ
jgi:hypothetical protein